MTDCMKVLVAEDNLFSRRMLKTILQSAGYAVVEAADGNEAWNEILKEDAPRLLILDWMMPGISGLDLCRQIAQKEKGQTVPSYIIMVTSKTDMEDVVLGLQSGAQDYITKPFDNEELKARIAIGKRILELQLALAERITQCIAGVPRKDQTGEVLPVCSVCKKIRDTQEAWIDIEDYVKHRFGVNFSHSLCPDCLEKHYDKYNLPPAAEK